MKPLRGAFAIALAALILWFGAAGASAADSFTIDELEHPGLMVAPNGLMIFEGTITTADGEGSIFGWVDGRLLTCDDYFGNDLDPDGPACWRVATVEDGRWRFAMDAALVERLGIDFYGPHEVTFTLTVYGANGDRIVVAEQSIDVEVVAEAPAAPEPEPTPVEPLPGDRAEVGLGEAIAGVLAASVASVADPSVLSSLRGVAEVVAEPGNVLLAAAVTLVLILLTGFPAVLLGQTVSENYERLMGWSTRPWAVRLREGVRSVRGAAAAPALPQWVPIAFGLGLATVISAFVEPGFGVDLLSLRLLLSMGLALMIETVLGWWVIRRVLAHLAPELHPRPEFRYGSLLILALAVLFSRVVGFEPGIVFGLVVGLAFGGSLAASRDAQVKLVGIGWALVVGLFGWVGYSLLSGLPGFLPLFLAETFSGIAVSSLAALPIALLPLATLDGEAVFQWNRWLWGACYAVALLIFFLVLLPMPFSWAEVGLPLAAWLGLYALFALGALALWAWFRFRSPRATEGSTQTQTPASASGEERATAGPAAGASEVSGSEGTAAPTSSV